MRSVPPRGTVVLPTAGSKQAGIRGTDATRVRIRAGSPLGLCPLTLATIAAAGLQ